MNELFTITKKNVPVIERACFEIPGFEKIKNDFLRKMLINGYSIGTYSNYIRHIAYMCISTRKIPEETSEIEIEEYLLYLKINNYSYNYFKHTVWGLYLFFRLFDKEERSFKVPRIPTRLTLPIVLSKGECKRFFNSAKSLKEKVLLYLVYSGGLRVSETCNLKWEEIDFSRKKILIRAGKNRKDRYVMLSSYLIKWLSIYRREYSPLKYVFNGRHKGSPMSTGTVKSIVSRVLKRSGIQKKVSCHTLRHSFATHLLEDGVDIVTIKELLGHSRIQHTLPYTHLVYIQIRKARSPLDTLYAKEG